MLIALVNKHVSSLGSPALTESTTDVMVNPESTNFLQFFDWESLLPIADEIPTPLNIIYDPLQVIKHLHVTYLPFLDGRCFAI
jgi:hypothetical protein